MSQCLSLQLIKDSTTANMTKEEEKDLEKAKQHFEKTDTQENVKYHVSVARRMRGDRFSSRDLLFRVKFEEALMDENEIPLLTVLHHVNRVVYRLIEDIRGYFDESLHSLVFFSLHAPGLVSDIYLGAQNLNDRESMGQVANRLMRLMYSCLMSNKTLPLNGFELRCTILSVEHRDHLQSRQRRRITRQMAGAVHLQELYNGKYMGARKMDGKKHTPFQGVLKRHLYTVPKGYKRAPEAFDQICLFVSFAIARLQNRAYEKSPKGCPDDLQILKALKDDKNPLKQEKAGLCILQMCHELAASIGVSLLEGPFKLGTLERLCEATHSAVYVYSKLLGNRLCYMHPSVVDHSRQKIFLYESSQLTEKIGHLDVIRFPPYIDGSPHALCCMRLVNSVPLHRCSAKRCPDCKKIILNPGDYFNYYMLEQFCGKLNGRSPKVKLTCQGCCKIFTDRFCYESHLKRCGESQACSECDVVIRAKRPAKKRKAGADVSPLAKKMAKHVCYQSLCRICYTMVKDQETKSHHCALKKVKFPKILPRLVIYDAETFIKNGEHRSCLISCVYESVLHGNFNLVEFGSNSIYMSSLQGGIHPSYITYDYLPSHIGNLIQKKAQQKEKSEIDERHFSLTSPALASASHRQAKTDFEGYLQVRKQYNHLPDEVRANPFFGFVCFFLQPEFYNSYLIAHYSSR